MNSRAIVSIFVVIATMMIGIGIIAPLMPLYAQQMGATGMWLGIIFAAFATTRMIFTPIFGRISDRFGRKWFLLTGLLAFTLLSLGYLVSNTVYELTLMRMAHGFSSALVVPIAFAYVGDLTPEKKEGRYMTVINYATFIGMAIGPFMGGRLADAYGIRSAFWALFGFGVLASTMVLLLLPDFGSRRPAEKSPLPGFRRMLSDDLVRGLLTIRAGSAARQAIVMAFLPVFAKYIGLTPTHMGALISVFIVTAAVVLYPSGILADRFDKTRIIIIGETFATICFGIFPFVKTFPQLVAGAIAAGMAGGLSMPSLLAINAEIGRDYGMASMMGLYDAAMGFGMLFATLTAGVVMDLFGVHAVFYYIVFLGLAGIGAFSFLRKQQRIPASNP
ncbi:MAG: MFS transporter [Candidatus Lindowbacteria bacterium]|nr:MFS transporter [Candidatus Lindowbacteria bacterium]